MHFSVDAKTARQVRLRGRYFRSEMISVRYLRDEGYRYSAVVSKRQGKAVSRNRVKRIIREIMRAGAGTLPSGSYLIYYNRACSEADGKIMAAEIGSLAAKIREIHG